MSYDRFPVRVTTPDGVIDRARFAYLDDGVARVYVEGPGRTVVEIATLEEAKLTTRGRRTWTVTSADGSTTWTVEKGAGCGCGSPLRSFRPQGQRARRVGT